MFIFFMPNESKVVLNLIRGVRISLADDFITKHIFGCWMDHCIHCKITSLGIHSGAQEVIRTTCTLLLPEPRGGGRSGYGAAKVDAVC